MVSAEFPVRRVSPNGQVTQDIIVVAVDPAQARRTAEKDGWAAISCDRAFWNSPAYYDTMPFIKEILPNR